MDLEKEFEQCYESFFPVHSPLMGIFSDMIGVSLIKQLNDPRYVSSGSVIRTDSYDIEPRIFGGIIMKVAFGMLDGDLEHLLLKFNGDARFNDTMRAIYAQHHRYSTKRTENDTEYDYTADMCELAHYEGYEDFANRFDDDERFYDDDEYIDDD